VTRAVIVDACAVTISVTTVVLVNVADVEGDIEILSASEYMVFWKKRKKEKKKGVECYAGNKVLFDWSTVRKNHNIQIDVEKDGGIYDMNQSYLYL
jgi:hypothetical protein